MDKPFRARGNPHGQRSPWPNKAQGLLAAEGRVTIASNGLGSAADLCGTITRGFHRAPLQCDTPDKIHTSPSVDRTPPIFNT